MSNYVTVTIFVSQKRNYLQMKVLKLYHLFIMHTYASAWYVSIHQCYTQ